MLKPYTEMKAIPYRGGAITRHHKALLGFGQFSMVQNIRPEWPGFVKRPGQAKLHTTADSTNTVTSLYQFRKRRIDETHFFAQMSDGDVLDATNQPPTVTTGVFGAEVFSGTASGFMPASWGNIDDILIYSNGVDQHKTYAGTNNYIDGLVKFDGSAAPPNVPEIGIDYTVQATDGLTTTVVILDSLNTLANNECVFICTPIPANRLTWTISAPNGTSAVGTLSYRKSDNTWADTSETDGTILSGATMGQTGAMTWTSPADEIPCYMYGKSGYWYQWKTATQLDGEVEITKVTYGSDFNDISNVWDGVVPYAIEAQFYDQSASNYKTFATGSIEIDDMIKETGAGNDDRDRLYFNSADPIMGIYVDVGTTPNTNTTAVVYGVKAWTGAAFTTVGTITDGTNGLTNSGWITWPRLTTVQPSQFKTSQYYSYWYYFWIGTANLSADVQISILTMPYFDIEEFGRGQSNAVWKDRPVISMTLWPNYLYVGTEGRPNAFNGTDFGILVAGDGRRNKVVAQRKFHNELVVWQEEKGVDGGTVTLFQGYTPTTFGKLLISSQIGTMSNKTVAVVDGVLTSTRTDEKIKDLIFFLSRQGVCVTDGMTISIISDDIHNYFDPTKTECIRRGYEDQMWLEYDATYNVIRIGLVSGSSATTPNIFLVFDLIDKSWGFDSLGQNLSCMARVEAGSGNFPLIHTGGGIGDGFVYLLNTGTDDVSTAIDSYTTMELNAEGRYIQLDEVVVRMKASSDPSSWTSKSASEANSWRAIAFGNDTFVATSIGGTNRVMISTDDGSTWTAKSATEDNIWYSITFGNNTFVAVASSGTDRVMISTDNGATWTAKSASEANAWRGIAFGNDTFVSVAGSGTNRVMVSTDDGATWTAKAAAEANSWSSVAFGNDTFVAVALDGTNRVMVSTDDGATWTAKAAAEANSWSSVAFGNDTFVAVSSGGTNRVMVSTDDGATWTAKAAAEDNAWQSIEYRSGTFVAVSSSGTNRVMVSTDDGATWTAKAAAEDNAWQALAFGNDTFVAVSSGGTNRVMVSSPGNITATFTKNNISAGSKTLTLAPEVDEQAIRRHRFNMNICDQNISLKLQDNTVGQRAHLLDLGLLTKIFEDR